MSESYHLFFDKTQLPTKLRVKRAQNDDVIIQLSPYLKGTQIDPARLDALKHEVFDPI